VTTNLKPPIKPWVVQTILDRGPGEYYRYSVTGWNHYYAPALPFAWSVPDLARYDLSQVQP